MYSFKQYFSQEDYQLAEQLGVSAKAQAAENTAFRNLGKVLNGKPIVSPAGFDAGFPDFAFRIDLTNGKTVDLHYEYKANDKAQMGSMRDWRFDGRKFYTNDTKNESKADLLEIMNNTPEAVKNGKRLLNDLQKHFDSRVKEISSSSLGVIKDKAERREATQQFVDNTKNYTVAKINDQSLGNKIIDHYKSKFKKNLVRGSDASVLFMMLKDKVWMVDTHGTLSKQEMEEIAARHGLKKFDNLKGIKAQLEVRIQPRGMNSPSKPTSIDVMANFRLSGSPSGGGTIKKT